MDLRLTDYRDLLRRSGRWHVRHYLTEQRLRGVMLTTMGEGTSGIRRPVTVHQCLAA